MTFPGMTRFEVVEMNLSSFTQSEPPAELLVVGEHRSDPLQLLLLGTDSNFYSYSMSTGATVQTEPDANWVVEEALVDAMQQELADQSGLTLGI
jgi:hypothetical protein